MTRLEAELRHLAWEYSRKMVVTQSGDLLLLEFVPITDVGATPEWAPAVDEAVCGLIAENAVGRATSMWEVESRLIASMDGPSVGDWYVR
jgi:hypothetical protein